MPMGFPWKNGIFTYMNGLNEWDQRRYTIQSSHGSCGVTGVEPGIFVSRYLDLFVFVGVFFFNELCHCK